MMRFDTLIDVIRERATHSTHGITFIEANSQEDFISYKELYPAALRMLHVLQQKGLQAGDELILQLEDNKSFLITFWACILGRIIPVPLTVGSNTEHRKKFFAVWPVLHNPYWIASGAQLERTVDFAAKAELAEYAEAVKQRFVDVEALATAQQEAQPLATEADAIAFIQFSSGSTGSPKGVVLTHRNLLTNVDAIARATRYAAGDALISWMPLTHDMGLIGFHISPLYSDLPHYLIPTAHFVRRPAIWLDAASQHGASILCSPNFGYAYTLKHIDLAEENQWDLSRVRVIYNGAEPISESLCESFSRAFHKFGLSPTAMRPVYGLAEASLAVSISAISSPIQSIRLRRAHLRIGEPVVVSPEEGSAAFVNVGTPVNECRVHILDEQGLELPAGTVGYVYISGANVTQGYYHNEEATRAAFPHDDRLKTGDLGFMLPDGLYITGRAKDIFFVNGQNFYPSDIERLAEEVEGIELNKVAVTGYFNPATQQEEVLAFVFHRGSVEAFLPLATALRQQLSRKAGLDFTHILPVKDIPRTTSGKLQRFKLLEQWQQGEFAAVRAQLAALTAESPAPAGAAGAATATEQALARLWQQVLGRKIQENASFFENGGNSLKVAELLMLVQKQWGVELSIRQVYQTPHLAELARRIEAQAGQAGQAAYRPIPPAAPQAHYAVSAAQKRLYYQWALAPASTAYNVPVAFRLVGTPDVAALEASLNHLVQRHEALRMVFELHPDGPVFMVREVPYFHLPLVGADEREWPAQLASLVQPFDLRVGPLFRFALLQQPGADCCLFLDFHHLVADGSSVHQLVQELLALYKGESLAPLPLTYKDFAAWECQNLAAGQLAEQRAFWQQHLAGEWPQLNLPLDYKRPLQAQTAGRKLVLYLDLDLRRKLAALAAQCHCSLAVLLFAAYKVLLAKYTGQPDVVIGLSTTGRRHADVQHLVGMLTSNLVVRRPLHLADSFEQTVRQENEHLLDLYQQQDVPFAELVDLSGRKSDPARNPLFDTMFVYQNMVEEFSATPDFALRPLPFDPGIAKFDLSLEIFEVPEGLQLGLEYATALFAPETVARLGRHFEQLLQQVVAAPTLAIGSISLLSPAEWETQMLAYNNTATAPQTATTVYELFATQAARQPDWVAVRQPQQTLTYAQLASQVAALAERLQAGGLRPGTVAAVYLPRSPQLLVALLAILKTGAAFLPLDTTLPAGRVAFILEDSRCCCVLSTTALLPQLPPPTPGRTLIDLAEPGTGPLSCPASPALVPGNAAYIIYTSGTTGKPKGVVIGQQSFANYITWACQEYAPQPQAVFPLFTSISFDLTITSIFTPLAAGGCVALYDGEEPGALLASLLRDNLATVVKLTPSHLRLMTATPLASLLRASQIARLVVGGEALDAALCQAVYNLFGRPVDIVNEYGPTEATVGCMVHHYAPAEPYESVPIGVPIANTQVYLLDHYLLPVPVGVVGRLYIAGAGLALGYLFNEEATREKFVPNPFAAGQVMYDSGDQARWLPGGVLDYVGRADTQVKLNGYRIELAEIEHCLQAYPGLAEAVVTVRENAGAQSYLVAYYTGAAGLAETQLANYLATQLPHYMIPARFVELAQLPLTANGKVAYAALPAPAALPPAATTTTTDMEALLLGVWQQVLGKQDIGVRDNFFELGGDSIKAVQLSARLLEQGVRLPSRKVFTAPTIERLALEAAPTDDQPPQEALSGPLPLFPMAQWFFAQGFAHPGCYNQTVVLEGNRPLNADTLNAAFDLLLRRHDGLRLNYDAGQQQLYYNPQHLAQRFAVTQHEAEAGATAHNLVQHLAGAAIEFDLGRELLLKATLLQDAAAKSYLLLTAHHLVTDGVSWRILLHDLYQFYTKLEQGQQPTVPAKTAPMTTWVQGLGQYLDSQAFRARLDYWHHAEASAWQLPQSLATSDWRSRHAHTLRAALPWDYAPLPGGPDTSLLLQAALLETLQQWTGQEEFSLLQENHGRHLDAPDVSATVGWFTAMYPVSWRWQGPDWAAKLASLQAQQHNLPRQGIGYLPWKYGRPTPAPQGPPPALRFNYLGQFGEEMANDLFTYRPELSGLHTHPDNALTAQLDLNILLLDKQLQLELHYNRQAQAPAAMQQLLDEWLLNVQRLRHYAAQQLPQEADAFLVNDADLTAQEIDTLFN